MNRTRSNLRKDKNKRKKEKRSKQNTPTKVDNVPKTRSEWVALIKNKNRDENG